MGAIGADAAKRPSWRHPLRRFRSYVATCSVKSAFILYALAAVVSAVALSCLVAGITSSIYSEVTVAQTRNSGMYLYDKDKNSLVPATTLTWYFPSDESEPQSVYVERGDSGSEYYPVIDLDAPPDGFDMMAVDDMDADWWSVNGVGSPSAASPIDPATLTFDTLPTYDETTNAARGDLAAVRAILSSDGSSRVPLVSRVGYYVYLAEGTWAEVFVWLTVVAIPFVCVACFVVAGRAFYRAKIEEPVRVMDDAARRIAAGDLDFSVTVNDGGELGNLAGSFETMRAELERAERAAWRSAENRRRANAAFAHDLRTPLTVLSGRAEMLEQFAPSGTLDGGQVADVARAMLRQTARLESYVASVRDVDALESYEPREVEVDGACWFAREVQAARDIADAYGVSLAARCDTLPKRMTFDGEAASRIVLNLVSNAARHAKTQVALVALWDDDVLRLRVEDDGEGFSQEALDNATKPYWRETEADESCQSGAHFGLGLNICAVLCDKLGGRLELSNAESGGAVAEAFLHAHSA